MTLLSKDILIHERGRIITYILNSNQKNIQSTIGFTGKEYDPQFWVYRGNKSQFENELEGFISLWVKQLYDAEEWNYQFNLEFATSIYDHWLLKQATKYNFLKVEIELMLNYILTRASEIKDRVIKVRKTHSINTYNLEYPNIPGIYFNKKISKETDFKFQINEKVISVIELSSSENWAGYKELFIETESDYIYFSE